MDADSKSGAVLTQPDAKRCAVALYAMAGADDGYSMANSDSNTIVSQFFIHIGHRPSGQGLYSRKLAPMPQKGVALPLCAEYPHPGRFIHLSFHNIQSHP